MLSLRAFTRVVPRTLSRSIATSVAKPLRPSPAAFQSAFKLSSRPAYAAFSTSRARFEAPVDTELAAKFEEELALEKESSEVEKVPETVQAFLDQGIFELHDTAGKEEVVLTRKYNDEKIRVTFTIADLQSLDGEEGFNENALQDELDPETGEKQSNTSQSSPNEEGMDEEAEPAYPVRVNVTIEKAGKGAMHVETLAQEGMIQIENVLYFKKSDLATADTAEKDWARNSLYSGPPFGNLDEGLQLLLERYLDERGIDASLATFVPDYIDFKEQQEYTRWLGNLKNFVEE